MNTNMKRNNNVEIEMPLFVNNKYCATCALGAACLLDGIVPDFEIAGVAGIFEIAD